jgi:hypothetical protein
MSTRASARVVQVHQVMRHSGQLDKVIMATQIPVFGYLPSGVAD